jgi:predicted nucleic acid-binding protein
MGSAVSRVDRGPKGTGSDARALGLDAGESAAIALAEWEADVLLLIDETAGRR